MPAELGSKAPDFTLLNTELQPVSLHDYAGKPVVLAFFPGAFTGVCTKEMCTFQDSLAQFNNFGAAVIGISVDTPFAQKAFATQNRLTFPLLSDFNRTVTAAYGVAHDTVFIEKYGLYGISKRAVFVVDREGIIRYRWVSEVPGVEPPYDEVKAAVQKV